MLGKRGVVGNNVKKVGSGQITEKYLIQDKELEFYSKFCEKPLESYKQEITWLLQ